VEGAGTLGEIECVGEVECQLEDLSDVEEWLGKGYDSESSDDRSEGVEEVTDSKSPDDDQTTALIPGRAS
jgi:hypothetical protein